MSYVPYFDEMPKVAVEPSPPAPPTPPKTLVSDLNVVALLFIAGGIYSYFTFGNDNVMIKSAALTAVVYGAAMATK